MNHRILFINIVSIVFASFIFLILAKNPSYAGTTVCTPPPPPPPACNSACTPGGAACPQECPSCLATTSNVTSGYTCQTQIACNTTCTKDADCAGARNGCTACITDANGAKTCQQPPSCNTACTKDTDCAGSRDGCTSCITASDGSQSCQLPPPSCNTACTKDADCAGARNGCTACITDANGAKTCQQPPSCGAACDINNSASCANVKTASGSDCSSCRPNSSGQNICQPTLTCNSSCTKDSDCNSGDALKNGCTSCLPGTNGQLSCQKNASCNSSCTKDSDCNSGDALKNGCTSCIANKCQTFNEDMCKCDGIEFTPIVSGQNVTVTNFEKVEGPNITKAKVKEMTFFFTKNNEIIEKSQPIAATIASQSPDKIRYQSKWTVKVPVQVDPKANYKIFAQVKCVKASELSLNSSVQTTVLGTTTSKPGFFSRIGTFFEKIFGGNTTVQSTESPSETPTTTPSQNGQEQLQINSFNPNVSVEKSCRFINFQFGE